MAQRLNPVDYLALALVIIGALNWGLVGAAGMNIVERVTMSWPIIARVIYGLIGIAGLYVAALSMSLQKS